MDNKFNYKFSFCELLTTLYVCTVLLLSVLSKYRTRNANISKDVQTIKEKEPGKGTVLHAGFRINYSPPLALLERCLKVYYASHHQYTDLLHPDRYRTNLSLLKLRSNLKGAFRERPAYLNIDKSTSLRLRVGFHFVLSLGLNSSSTLEEVMA